MTIATNLLFRFDREHHQYIDLATGELLPHITEMLERTGWINDDWYTEESSARGTAVHALATRYLLEGWDTPMLNVAIGNTREELAGYFRSFIKAMQVLRPEILAVEEPMVHPHYRYGGRPDLVAKLTRAIAVIETKTGAPEKSHQIQTALQAILVAPRFQVQPSMILRYGLYTAADGKMAKLIPHTDKRDHDEARRVIRKACDPF